MFILNIFDLSIGWAGRSASQNDFFSSADELPQRAIPEIKF